MSDNYDDIIETLSDDEVEEIPPAPIPGSAPDYDYSEGEVEEIDAEVVRDGYGDGTPSESDYNNFSLYNYSIANPLALVSVLCGVLSVVCCFGGGAFNMILSIAAIATGIISIIIGRDSKHFGLSIAGIAAGGLGFGLSILAMIFNGIGALLKALWH